MLFSHRLAGGRMERVSGLRGRDYNQRKQKLGAVRGKRMEAGAWGCSYLWWNRGKSWRLSGKRERSHGGGGLVRAALWNDQN